MKAKSDFIFLGILGALIANTIIQCVLYSHLLSTNNYLGFAAWLLVLFLRISNRRMGRYGTGLLLILGTINILNFGIGRVSISISFGDIGNVPIESIGLNPVSLLLLIIYYFVNKNTVNLLLSGFLHGSTEDQNEEYQKNTDFYLKKFEGCDEVEFEKIFNNLNEYPTEAQIALKQIRDKKGSSSDVRL